MTALPRSFYERDTVTVARELLGKTLENGYRSARIVEVEAYLAQNDPAAHAYRGLTDRTRVLFGPGGYAYVYLIYGLHYCLNVSAEPDGVAGCVLIRGVEGVSGPGRVTRHFGISLDHYGADLTRGPLTILDGPAPARIDVTARIGIAKAIDLPLRFVCSGNDSRTGTGGPSRLLEMGDGFAARRGGGARTRRNRT